MAQSVRFAHAPDQSLVRQFIGVVGRRPTPEELRRYRSARSCLTLRLPCRARRGPARPIVRL
jgi:hypothetical protein